MRKNLIILASAALLLQSCTFVRLNMPDTDGWVSMNGAYLAAGSETATMQSTALNDFNSLVIDANIDVKYAYTLHDPGITVKGPSNYIELLDVKVVDGTLILSSADGSRFMSGKLTATLSSRSLDVVTISGAGNFETDEKLSSDSFMILLNGAGDVEINSRLKAGKVTAIINGAGDIDIDDLDSDEFYATVDGAGDIRVSGRTGNAVLQISGAGDIDATRLTMDSSSCTTYGRGEIKTK